MDDKEKTQTTTQTNTPVGTPAINYALQEAQSLYQNPRPMALPPLNWVTQNAFDRTHELARAGVPGLDQAQNYATGMIANNGMTGDTNRVAGYLNDIATAAPGQNPYLQQMLETNAARAGNAAATQFGGGRYGSNAIGQGVGQAVSNANNATIAQAYENDMTRKMQATGLLGNMYEAGLGRAAQATSMLPALNDLRYDPAQRLAGIGDYEQNRQQAEWDYPQTRLGQFSGLVQALGGMGGTATSVAPVQRASTAQRLIGGALAGSALGSKVPFLGTTGGAIGGGLLGLFG